MKNLFEYHRMVLDSDLDASAKLLLLALSSWAAGPAKDLEAAQTLKAEATGWKVWPPTSDLCARTSMSERTLRRTIQDLEKLKTKWLSRQIVVIGGKQRRLFLLPSNPCQSVRGNPGQNGQPLPICQGVKMANPCQSVRGKGGQPVRGTSSVEETSKETKEERQSLAKASRASPSLIFSSSEEAKARAKPKAKYSPKPDPQTNPNPLLKIWADVWGNMAIPPCLLTAEPDKALTAIAWLLHKRDTGGVKNPAFLAKLLLTDLEQGSKATWSGWNIEDLQAVSGGTSPQNQEYARRRRAREGRERQEQKRQGPAGSRQEAGRHGEQPPKTSSKPRQVMKKAALAVIKAQIAGDDEAYALAQAEFKRLAKEGGFSTPYSLPSTLSPQAQEVA